MALFQNPLIENFNSPSHHYLSEAFCGIFLCTGLMGPGSGSSGSTILSHGKKRVSQTAAEARNQHAYSMILLHGKNTNSQTAAEARRRHAPFAILLNEKKHDWARGAILLFKFDNTFSDVSAILISFTLSFLGLLCKVEGHLSCNHMSYTGYNISMEYVWNMCAISVEYVRLYKICMEYLWNTYGICMEYVWNTCGIMYGICME